MGASAVHIDVKSWEARQKNYSCHIVPAYLFNTVKMTADPVKVYTVNGAATSSSSSLPDWLTRKRAAKAKGKRAIREHVEGTIELIQGFEFPEASNRVKTTRDGHHVIATGTYKPQIRVWDLDQLTLKFERHSDAENVDFVVRELVYIPCSNRLIQILIKKTTLLY